MAVKRNGVGRRSKFETGKERGETTAVPRVFTEMVKGAVLPEVMLTLAGGVQVAPKGTPAQANARVPVKPLPGVA